MDHLLLRSVFPALTSTSPTGDTVSPNWWIFDTVVIILQITVETIQHIRTVIQLTKEAHFYDEYSRFLDILYRYLCNLRDSG
jgi:hypothetical protein